MDEQDKVAGHAFISYVREDSGSADQLQQMLEAAGVRVWRDTADLWPGEDWRRKIRRAITDNALVFIACFSHQSLTRRVSYQREELRLAIEQLRLRPPGDPWLIPVRFDDCDVPDLDIGGGLTLASIQRADLFGDQSDEGAVRLVTAVLRILGQYSAASPATALFGSDDAGLLARLEAEARRVRAAVLESARQETGRTHSLVGTASAATSRQSAWSAASRNRTGGLQNALSGIASMMAGRSEGRKAGRGHGAVIRTGTRHSPVRTCMLGPPSCGKTTYLAVLDIAVARATGDWLIRGADDEAEDFLHLNTMALASRRFPAATQTFHPLSWTITGNSSSDVRSRRDRASAVPLEIRLDLLDIPGGAFDHSAAMHNPVGFDSLWEPDSSDWRDDEDPITHLAMSDGFLLLFDPVIASDGFSYHDYLQRAFLALCRSANSLRLHHDIAVCIAKFDDPRVYNKAVAGGHIALSESPMSLPSVSEDHAPTFFRALCDDQAGTNDLAGIFQQYFHPSRIKYFVTSSIGFYVSPKTGLFSGTDFENVVHGEHGMPRIRGRVRPVNVLEPLLWLAQQRLSRDM